MGQSGDAAGDPLRDEDMFLFRSLDSQMNSEHSCFCWTEKKKRKRKKRKIHVRSADLWLLHVVTEGTAASCRKQNAASAPFSAD